MTQQTTDLNIGDEVDLEINRIATGGAAIATAADGRVVFVDGAIPGEFVTATIDEVHKSRIMATTTNVKTASADRAEPGCSHVSEGCGGCDWQHIAQRRQTELKANIVNDCLRRIAKIENIEATLARPLNPTGYRTTIRALVVNGKAGYRKRSSHDAVMVSSCLTAHPALEELLVEGEFGQAKEVTLRIGVETGERVALLSPTAEGVKLSNDVKIISTNQIKSKKVKTPYYYEVINGKKLRISAGAFFQCRPDGAALLVDVVSKAIGDGTGTLLDAYCGVGLFGVLLGAERHVVGVESNASAVKDAVENYKTTDKVIKSRFERWRAEPVEVAVCDPARTGLKSEGCERLAAAEPKTIALVSCDPASMARDAALLAESGYALADITVVDMFPQTSHIETVAKFVAT